MVFISPSWVVLRRSLLPMSRSMEVIVGVVQGAARSTLTRFVVALLLLSLGLLIWSLCILQLSLGLFVWSLFRLDLSLFRLDFSLLLYCCCCCCLPRQSPLGLPSFYPNIPLGLVISLRVNDPWSCADLGALIPGILLWCFLPSGYLVAEGV